MNGLFHKSTVCTSEEKRTKSRTRPHMHTHRNECEVSKGRLDVVLVRWEKKRVKQTDVVSEGVTTKGRNVGSR